VVHRTNAMLSQHPRGPQIAVAIGGMIRVEASETDRRQPRDCLLPLLWSLIRKPRQRPSRIALGQCQTLQSRRIKPAGLRPKACLINRPSRRVDGPRPGSNRIVENKRTCQLLDNKPVATGDPFEPVR
jgi:hypothetical protein